MTRYRKVTIPRPDGFDLSRLGAYHLLLRDQVYPLVDNLLADGLIEGYDFLSHTGVDLRLWINDGASD